MMKKKFSAVFVLIIFLIGLSIFLYPTVSNFLNSVKQTETVGQYIKAVEKLSQEDHEQIWRKAEEYNRSLLNMSNRYYMTEEEREYYNSLLNVSGNGVMGYLQIPKMGETIPVYHGTDESVLQIAVGHLEGSSLPIGGESSHCVITGHSGLPEARLFTGLNKLREGDIFYLHILGKTLTYEIDQILVELPENREALKIEEGKDYCTLMTCTPYGINTHRLFVRGHRV